MSGNTSYAIALLIFLTAVSAIADRIIVIKSEKKTSNDIPLEFILEKTNGTGETFGYGGQSKTQHQKPMRM